MKRFVFVLLLFVLPFSNSRATQDPSFQNGPVITGISVAHASPGQSKVEATVTGKNFAGFRELTLGRGVTIDRIQSARVSAIRFTFSVSRTASLGPRSIQVVTSSGTAAKDGLFSISNSKPPTARINVTPPRGKTSQTFRFDASRSSDPDGQIKSYAWQFGDGGRKSGKIARHRFHSAGNYKVKLTVKDNKGVTDQATRVLQVKSSGSGQNPGSKCSRQVRKKERHPDLYGRVISADKSRKVLVVKLDSQQTCATAFYKCGDVKRGDGIRTPYEDWYGTICKMEYLGDNTFRIHLVKGHKFPTAGTSGVYLHWQPCAKPWCK